MENCDVEAATVVKGTVRLSTVTTVSIPMITFKLFLKTMPTILLIWTNSLAILNMRLHQLYRLAMVNHAWRLVYNMTQGLALCCVVTGSAYKMIWMATQCRNRNVFYFFAIQIILYALLVATQHKLLRHIINQPWITSSAFIPISHYRLPLHVSPCSQ